MNTQLAAIIEEGLNALQGQQFSKAESLFRQALQKAEDAKDELSAAKSLDNIGEVFFQQGYFDQAEPYFSQALEIRQKLLPAEHEDIISSLNNLSVAYFFQGKYSQAKPLCEQLMTTYEIVLGPEHPELATCLINLGLIAMAEGQLDYAEQYFAQSIIIRQSNFEPTDILIGNSLSHLGNVYFEQKRYEEAAEKFKEALNVLKVHHDLDNADLQVIIGKLVYSLEQTNNFAELEQLYANITSAIEIKLGPAHIDVIKYLEKLASVFLKEKKYEEGEKIFQRLLSMKRRACGDVHPEVARQLANLALVKQASGNIGQAETLFLQALNMHESYKIKTNTGQAPTLSQYLEALKNLAIFYDSDKRYAKSEKEWQRLIQLCESQSKIQSEFLFDVYEHFACSLIAQKRSAEAQLFLKKALILLDKSGDFVKLDKTDLSLKQAHIITKLADALKGDNKYNEAENQYKTALDILMKSLGPNHPQLIPTLEGYADLLTLTYREPEAEHMLNCARALTQNMPK